MWVLATNIVLTFAPRSAVNNQDQTLPGETDWFSDMRSEAGKRRVTDSHTFAAMAV